MLECLILRVVVSIGAVGDSLLAAPLSVKSLVRFGFFLLPPAGAHEFPRSGNY
jgi:hypothetical protein